MFEHRQQALLPAAAFARRVRRSSAFATALIGAALALGTVGYHLFADLDWVDSLLNASMILTGMGPVAPLTGTPAKLFASAYALFSGVVFLAGIGVVAAPLFHRFIHRFHLEDDDR